MVLDKQVAGFASVRAAMTLPVAPLQYIVNWPTQIIDTLKSVLSSHDELIRENLKLKSDQLLLQSKLQRLIAIESENNYLKKLIQSSKQVKGKTLIAELMGVASTPFASQVTIDKGTRDGVYVGQPVLDANGVMGQVIEVGPITSRVILVNDHQSGMSVQNARNGMRAVALGDGMSGKLRLKYVSKTADVKPGDLFLTSGFGDHYPEGYPVGKVVLIKNIPTNQFNEVYLEPSARLESSRQVLLIWYKKNA